MLEEMATAGGDASIVSWQPHGKAFRVHRPDAFASTVMPRYFKQQKKYKSFQRQLHIYGFHRIGKGMDRGAYFHSMFIRNQKSMSLRMSCQKIKGKKCTKAGKGKNTESIIDRLAADDQGKKKSSKVVDHYAAGDPDFYCDHTNLDNDLANVSHAYPTVQEKKSGFSELGPATVFPTAGSNVQHTNEDKSRLNSAPLFFDQEVIDSAGPPPSDQFIDWMEQAQTFLWCDDEHQASPSDQTLPFDHLNVKVRNIPSSPALSHCFTHINGYAPNENYCSELQPSYSHSSITNGLTLSPT